MHVKLEILQFVILSDWSGVFVRLKMFGCKCEDFWMQHLRYLDRPVLGKREQTFNVFPSKRVNHLEGSPMNSSQQMKCSRRRGSGEHCTLTLLPLKDNVPLTPPSKLTVALASPPMMSFHPKGTDDGHKIGSVFNLQGSRWFFSSPPPSRRPRAAAPALRHVPSLSVDEIWDWQCV